MGIQDIISRLLPTYGNYAGEGYTAGYRNLHPDVASQVLGDIDDPNSFSYDPPGPELSKHDRIVNGEDISEGGYNFNRSNYLPRDAVDAAAQVHDAAYHNAGKLPTPPPGRQLYSPLISSCLSD